jgi:hypothetical protein
VTNGESEETPMIFARVQILAVSARLRGDSESLAGQLAWLIRVSQ